MTRVDYWNRFNARQRAIEKKFAGAVYLAIKKQYISAINAVRTRGAAYVRANIDTIVSPVGIVKVLKRLYRYSAYVEGNYVGSSLIKNSGFGTRKGADMSSSPISLKRVGTRDASFAIGFDEIAEVVDEYFRLYQLNISALPITETTRKHIIEKLLSEIDRGVPLSDAITKFREIALTGGNSLSRNRAKAIIQTESTRAMSFGGLIGAYKSGVDVDKVWVTCADEKVRDGRYSHRVLDGQVSTLFGAFRNSEPIKFPGDPEASKGNTINCRCTQFFMEKRRPQPRITGRTLQRFLTDFFTGFFIGSQIFEGIINELLPE